MLKLIYPLIFFFLLTTNSFAFRCSCDIIETGDPKFQVIKLCGKPIAKKIIGYSRSGLKIEELIYYSNGYYYYLKFVGNRLVKIEAVRD